MRFQTRDGEILQAIYEYGGLLAGRHLQEMFWPDKSLRAMQKRLSELFTNGYIARPQKRIGAQNPFLNLFFGLIGEA